MQIKCLGHRMSISKNREVWFENKGKRDVKEQKIGSCDQNRSS